MDTNVLISGLLVPGSPPQIVIDARLEGGFTLVTSPYLVEGFIHALSYPRIAERIRLAEEDLNALTAALLSLAEVTTGRLALPGVTRDPKDDPVVACAKEGRADYIVTGDEDLLAVGEYEGIRIVTPRRFVDILEHQNWPPPA